MAVPTAALQAPVSGGVCPAIVGMASPLASLGVQVVLAVLQK